MLKTLFKHDMRANLKFMSPVYLVAVAITILSLIIVKITESSDSVLMRAMISPTFNVLYFVAVFAIYVGTPIIIAVVFYKTMVTHEGYLTHTLPVTTKQLIISKTLAGVVNIAISFVVDLILLAAYYFVLVDSEDSFLGVIKQDILDDLKESGLKQMKKEFSQLLDEHMAAVVIFIILFIVLLIINMFSTLLTYFAVVSVGQMVKKHKVLAMIGFYIGFTTLFQYVVTLIVFGIFTIIGPHVESIPIAYLVNGYMVGVVLITFVIGLICYIISVRSFKTKLNLD